MARVSNTNGEMYRGLAFKVCGLGLESLVCRARQRCSPVKVWNNSKNWHRGWVLCGNLLQQRHDLPIICYKKVQILPIICYKSAYASTSTLSIYCRLYGSIGSLLQDFHATAFPWRSFREGKIV